LVCFYVQTRCFGENMDAIFEKDREFTIVTTTGCGIFITGSDFAGQILI
jgi:hypothetical protein